MPAPKSAVEGQSTRLKDIYPDLSADRELHLRKQVVTLNRRLRSSLGLREDPISLEDGDEPGIKIRGVSGSLRLAGAEIEISPKHAQDGVGKENWRQGLIQMLERSSPRKVAFTRSRRLQLKHRTFLDQFAFSFALELEHATEHEPIRRYHTFREESKFLLGRLVVSEQLRKSTTRPDLLICDVDRLDTTNDQNRLLAWVGQQLLTKIRDHQVRRLLSVQVAKLPVMPATANRPTRISAVVPRQYAHYSGALQLASAYSRGQSVFPGLASVDGATFLVGTEKLFESFLEKSLLTVCVAQPSPGWTLRPQATEPFADGVGHKRTFFSKPDNIIDIDSAPALVIDAKYKRFTEATDLDAGSKPSNSDIYQMAAACLAHNCQKAVLIYPRMSARPDEPPTWQIQWWKIRSRTGNPIYVGAACVDLSSLSEPTSMDGFDEQLAQLLQEAIAYPPAGPSTNTATKGES